MPVFEHKKLEEDCAKVFEGAGMAAEEAGLVARSLVLSNLAGHDSHGVIRVTQYVDALKNGIVKAGQKIRIVKEAGASAVVDGGWGFGQTVCHQALNLAIEKARARSVGVVEMFNSSHIGRLGEYVEAAAAAGVIGLVTCNNHGGGQLLCPHGGIDARMSPNPIAVGVPKGGDYPIVVDMTTSVVAEGKIRVMRNRGEELPEGWAIDSDGKPITSPHAFYGPPRGAILPFGGIAAHKGYALAVVLDILAGALGGAGCSCKDGPSGGNGVFIMAIDIKAFTGEDTFQIEVDTFVDYLRSSRLAEGFDEILMPGEVEHRTRMQRERDGIAVDDETWRQIKEKGREVGADL